MFDDIVRGLERIPEKQMVSVRVPLDEEGYYDRRCPASDCGREFKVFFEDWNGKVTATAYCAICRESADPADFNTDEQSRYFQQQALAHLRGEVDDVFRGASGRTMRAGVFTMKLKLRRETGDWVLSAGRARLDPSSLLWQWRPRTDSNRRRAP